MKSTGAGKQPKWKNPGSVNSSGKSPATQKRILSELELLAVCAMDSLNYLKRQKRKVELVRLRYDKSRMPRASTQVVRVYATKKVTLITVPSGVADILAKKGVPINTVYPKPETTEGASK